jgi:hypothetical protein
MANDLQNLLGDGSSGPLIHLPKSVATKNLNVRAGREGELVTLTIGGSTLRMPWETAMQLGRWLIAKAAEAKVQSGEINTGR